MKIVFDTNVILSAFLTQGLSARVLDICIGLHKLYISPWIINEVNEVLRSKFTLQEKQLVRVNKFIKDEFHFINPSGAAPLICRDPDDNNILHIAEFIKADILITGDKDLLSLKEYLNTKIINPRQFMEQYYHD
jgi:putative PIN family toxin of toxin-antitoxin system